MAGPNDGSGTVWVHDSPVGAPERDEAPAAPVAPAAPPPAVATSSGPPPMVPAPVQAKSSGLGSTGCLVAVFILGGVGLGLVVLLAIGLVGAMFYLQ